MDWPPETWLTAAIAIAVLAQALITLKLWKLQRSVEEHRKKTDIYLARPILRANLICPVVSDKNFTNVMVSLRCYHAPAKLKALKADCSFQYSDKDQPEVRTVTFNVNGLLVAVGETRTFAAQVHPRMAARGWVVVVQYEDVIAVGSYEQQFVSGVELPPPPDFPQMY